MKRVMNSKGVFLTMMVFLVVVTVLVLFQGNQGAQSDRKTLQVEEAAFVNINDAFERVYFDLISLGKTGSERRIQTRGLMFDYAMDQNTLSVRNRIPVSAQRLSSFYDYVNSYRVFLRAAATTDAGMRVDLNLDRSGIQTAWPASTGRFPQVDYVLSPQCVDYRINDGNSDPPEDLNYFEVLPSSALGLCSVSQSDLVLLSRTTAVSVTLSVPYSVDVDVLADVSCPGNGASNGFFTGGGACFNSLSGTPTDANFEVFLETPSVPLTRIAARRFSAGASEHAAIVHFRPSGDDQNSTVEVRLFTKNLSGNVVRVLWVSSRRSDGSPAPVVVTLSMKFADSIRSFTLFGADLNVSKYGFDLDRFS
jgi:hypothetical protein